jgi:hypothetical protein
MADSSGGDHTGSVSDLGRPGSPSTSGRRAYWWTGTTIVLVAAVVIGLLAASSGKDDHAPRPSGTPSPRLRLPSSATHDANGLILTLPGIAAVIGETPLPGVSLSGDVLSHETLDGITAVKETNGGLVNTAARYRSLSVTLTRWPTVDAADRTWDKAGHGAYRVNAHRWYGATTPVAGLGHVYQMSDGPYRAADGRTGFDHVGPVLEARYRNVVIRIDFDSADFAAPGSGTVKVSYGSAAKAREDLVTMARTIVEHL